MEQIKKYIRGIFNGLKNMHELGLCHRDLKPDNILFQSETDEIKITDFG